MAHFAQIDSNSVVTQVIVVNNETIGHLPFPDSEPVGVAFCQSLFGSDTTWKQTSYNGNFRKNYAVLGAKYDVDLDAFIPPKPYASWVLNTQTGFWDPPVPCPNYSQPYVWDENSLSWVEMSPDLQSPVR